MQYPDRTHHLLCQAPNPLTSSNIVFWSTKAETVKLHPSRERQRSVLTIACLPGSPSPPPWSPLHTAASGRCGPPGGTGREPLTKSEHQQELRHLWSYKDRKKQEHPYLLKRKLVFPDGGQGERVRSHQDKVAGANRVGASWTRHDCRRTKVQPLIWLSAGSPHKLLSRHSYSDLWLWSLAPSVDSCPNT